MLHLAGNKLASKAVDTICRQRLSNSLAMQWQSRLLLKPPHCRKRDRLAHQRFIYVGVTARTEESDELPFRRIECQTLKQIVRLNCSDGY